MASRPLVCAILVPSLRVSTLWGATEPIKSRGQVVYHEGYLWNEHHEPVEVRREGRDLKRTQLELDDATKRLGHVCSEQCEAWSSRPPAGYFR